MCENCFSRRVVAYDLLKIQLIIVQEPHHAPNRITSDCLLNTWMSLSVICWSYVRFIDETTLALTRYNNQRALNSKQQWTCIARAITSSWLLDSVRITSDTLHMISIFHNFLLLFCLLACRFLVFVFVFEAKVSANLTQFTIQKIMNESNQQNVNSNEWSLSLVDKFSFLLSSFRILIIRTSLLCSI